MQNFQPAIQIFKMLPNYDEDQLHFYAWITIGVAMVSLISSFFCSTPYGRYSRYSWGFGHFGVDARLAWFMQETPSFLVPFAMFMVSDNMRELMSLNVSPNVVLLFMFMVHYFRRSFIYPFWIKKTAPTPFLILVYAFIFCTMNGYVQGQYHLHVGRYSNEWFHSLQFVLGSFLFLLGFAINVHSDYVLTHLRQPGETGHKIPRGGLFEYISCPNFFGEIMEWGGFWLASSSFVAFAFFCNTFFALACRASYHHRFYHKKFEDYPKDRKAVFPFIF